MHKLFSISAAMLAMAITFEGASPASAASVTCTSAGDYTCSAGTAGGCARAIRKLKELDNTSDDPIGSLSMIAGAGQMPPMSQMSIAVGFMQRFDPVNFDVITETMENGELRVTVFPVGSDRPVMRQTAKASHVRFVDRAHGLSMPVNESVLAQPRVRLNLQDMRRMGAGL